MVGVVAAVVVLLTALVGPGWQPVAVEPAAAAAGPSLNVIAGCPR